MGRLLVNRPVNGQGPVFPARTSLRIVEQLAKHWTCLSAAAGAPQAHKSSCRQAGDGEMQFP